MNIFDILRLRTKFEEIISYRKTYDLPNYDSNIDSLYYFINHAGKKNRFRKRFDEAMVIATKIIESYENENFNLSSLHWKEK